MPIYEHFWDCPACGTENISALRQKKCPKCGHSKTSQDVEKRTRIEVTDERGLALAMGGENWVCSSCGSTNLKEDEKCLSCGNPKEESDHVNEVRELDTLPPPVYSLEDIDQQEEENEEEKQGGLLEYPQPLKFTEPLQTTKNFAEKKSFLNLKTIGISAFGFLIIALFTFLVYGLFNTQKVEGTVSGFSWSRDVVIEHYQTVHYTNRSSTPAGAYNITSREDSHQVPVYRSETTTRDCSYDTESCTDLGNGSESCTTAHHSQTCSETHQVLDHYDTVYDTYYSYDIDEWVYKRTARAKGNDKNPYWPEYSLNFGGQTIIGAERVGSKPETYTVYFEVNEEDEINTYSLTQSEFKWNQYVEGNQYPLEINHFDAIVNDPLQDKVSATQTALSE